MLRSVSIQNAGHGLFALHGLAVVSGYLGATVGVSMVVPQIVRTLRNRSMPGVSASSWALTALACLSWLMYGLRMHEFPQVPGNLLIVLGSVLIVLAVPAEVGLLRRAAYLAGPGAVIGVLALTAPRATLGLIGFAIGLCSAAPQMLASLTRQGAGESAVSMLAWALRGGSQMCWMFYAFVLHDRLVAISATITLGSALVVLLAELVRGGVRLTPTDVAAEVAGERTAGVVPQRMADACSASATP